LFIPTDGTMVSVKQNAAPPIQQIGFHHFRLAWSIDYSIGVN